MNNINEINSQIKHRDQLVTVLRTFNSILTNQGVKEENNSKEINK